MRLIALVSNDRGRQSRSDMAIWLKTWILDWNYNTSQLLRNRILLWKLHHVNNLNVPLLDVILPDVFSVHHLLWVSKWLATRSIREAYTEKPVIAIDAKFRDYPASKESRTRLLIKYGRRVCKLSKCHQLLIIVCMTSSYDAAI